MGGTGEEEEENDNGIVTNPIITKIMPRLQFLEIIVCHELKSLPNYLLTAPSLKNLKICKSRLLQERYHAVTGEDWHKISHISDIMLGPSWVQEDGEPLFDSKVTLLPFFFFLYFIFFIPNISIKYKYMDWIVKTVRKLSLLQLSSTQCQLLRVHFNYLLNISI